MSHIEYSGNFLSMAPKLNIVSHEEAEIFASEKRCQERAQDLLASLGDLEMSEQLLVLQKLQHLVIKQSQGQVCSAKLNGGASSELYACMAMTDLTWNGAENNGADAYDKQGRGVELKTFAYRKKKCCNAHITFPARAKDEDDQTFRERVVQHFRESKKYVGGLRMVAMSKSKSVVHHWYVLPREILPRLAETFLLKHPKDKELIVNGTPCNKCGLVHRMAQMQRAASQGQAQLLVQGRACVAIPKSQYAVGVTVPNIP